MDRGCHDARCPVEPDPSPHGPPADPRPGDGGSARRTGGRGDRASAPLTWVDRRLRRKSGPFSPIRAPRGGAGPGTCFSAHSASRVRHPAPSTTRRSIAMSISLTCGPSGAVITGDTEEELVSNVQAHARAHENTELSRERILAQIRGRDPQRPIDAAAWAAMTAPSAAQKLCDTSDMVIVHRMFRRECALLPQLVAAVRWRRPRPGPHRGRACPRSTRHAPSPPRGRGRTALAEAVGADPVPHRSARPHGQPASGPRGAARARRDQRSPRGRTRPPRPPARHSPRCWNSSRRGSTSTSTRKKRRSCRSWNASSPPPNTRRWANGDWCRYP